MHDLTMHVEFDIVRYVVDRLLIIVVEVVERSNQDLKNQENVIANEKNERHENLDEEGK